MGSYLKSMMADSYVTSIKSILAFQIIFGLYYDHFTERHKRVVVKFLCFIIAVIQIYMSTCTTFDVVLKIIKIFLYGIPVLLSLYTGNNYFFEYIKFNETIDSYEHKTKWNKKTFKLLKGYIISLATFYTTFFVVKYYNEIYNQNLGYSAYVAYFFTITIRFGITIASIPVLLIFFLFYWRIKTFCRLLKKNSKNEPIHWKKKAQLYINIMNSMKKTEVPVNIQVIIYIKKCLFESCFCYYFIKIMQ